MATPAFDVTDFFLAWCEQCRKDVLPYIALEGEVEETRRCLHCDAIVDASLRVATAADLEAAGYSVVEARACGNGGGCGAGCGARANAATENH